MFGFVFLHFQLPWARISSLPSRTSNRLSKRLSPTSRPMFALRWSPIATTRLKTEPLWPRCVALWVNICLLISLWEAYFELNNWLSLACFMTLLIKLCLLVLFLSAECRTLNNLYFVVLSHWFCQNGDGISFCFKPKFRCTIQFGLMSSIFRLRRRSFLCKLFFLFYKKSKNYLKQCEFHQSTQTTPYKSRFCNIFAFWCIFPPRSKMRFVSLAHVFFLFMYLGFRLHSVPRQNAKECRWFVASGRRRWPRGSHSRSRRGPQASVQKGGIVWLCCTLVLIVWLKFWLCFQNSRNCEDLFVLFETFCFWYSSFSSEVAHELAEVRQRSKNPCAFTRTTNDLLKSRRK